MPLAVENYRLLQLLSAIFGISFASSFSFTPIILVELVDLDDFTCAYGEFEQTLSMAKASHTDFVIRSYRSGIACDGCRKFDWPTAERHHL